MSGNDTIKAQPIGGLEKAAGYTFKNQDLLRRALTHASTGEDGNYERLEFLGDRVLGLIIAELLFARFPEESEGDLAKRQAALVQGEWLAVVAGDIGLGGYILMSEAEAQSGGGENENRLADVFEALIGAIYLDGGLVPCRALITRLWDGRMDAMKAPPQHPKTALQEWAQGLGLPLPVYKIVEQSGPDHAPVFIVELSVKGFDSVRSEGRTRQAAERAAAAAFMNQRESQSG